MTTVAGRNFVKLINLDNGSTEYTMIFYKEPYYYNSKGIEVKNNHVSLDNVKIEDELIETFQPYSCFREQLSAIAEDVKQQKLDKDTAYQYESQVREMLHAHGIIQIFAEDEFEQLLSAYQTFNEKVMIHELKFRYPSAIHVPLDFINEPMNKWGYNPYMQKVLCTVFFDKHPEILDIIDCNDIYVCNEQEQKLLDEETFRINILITEQNLSLQTTFDIQDKRLKFTFKSTA